MRPSNLTRPAEILLVEDNLADVRLTKEALRESRIDNRLHVVGDGEEAMAFLRRENPFQTSPRPDLILLDLNLPRKDGREVLAELKHDAAFRRIPVVIQTTSKDSDDITRSYDLHANSYVTKPVSLKEFLSMVHFLQEYWFSIVTLPTE